MSAATVSKDVKQKAGKARQTSLDKGKGQYYAYLLPGLLAFTIVIVGSFFSTFTSASPAGTV